MTRNRRTRALVALLAWVALASVSGALAQALPSVPAPSGVALSSNPLDDGVSIAKWGLKILCVLVSLAALGGAAALGMPKFFEAANNRATYGQATFNLFMLILGAVIVCLLCAFVFSRIDGGGAITQIAWIA